MTFALGSQKVLVDKKPPNTHYTLLVRNYVHVESIQVSLAKLATAYLQNRAMRGYVAMSPAGLCFVF